MAANGPEPRLQIFGLRRPRLLRTSIPLAENLSAALLGFVLIALVAWVMSTGNDFDPTERDLPIELQLSSARDIPIYTPPLKPWVDPARPVDRRRVGPGAFPRRHPGCRMAAGRPREALSGGKPVREDQRRGGEVHQAGLRRAGLPAAALRPRWQRDRDRAVRSGRSGRQPRACLPNTPPGAPCRNRAGSASSPPAAGVIGRVDRYFFRAAGDRDSDAITAKALGLVGLRRSWSQRRRRADGAARPSCRPASRCSISASASRRRTSNSKRANVFQYDFARRFWFADAGLDGEARVFLHIAEDAAAAEALIDALLAEHRYDYDDSRRATAVSPFCAIVSSKTYFVVTREGNVRLRSGRAGGQRRLPRTGWRASARA